jgi:glycosyltransferase involved in cell wall biosynthesis
VALVAPPWYPVPPSDYGGIERVVYLLARELTRRGHRVTVFGRPGAGDMPIAALADESWAEDLGGPDEAVRLEAYLTRVHRRLRQGHWHVVHDHCSTMGVAIGLAAAAGPLVATLHGPVSNAQAEFLAEVDDEVGLVAISHAQQVGAPSLRWSGMVHNAAPLEELAFSAENDGYLVQLARISPEKGQHLSIEIAREVGLPLILAGKIGEETSARDYFRTMVLPSLGEDVVWLPQVGGHRKAQLLGRARAMLFPVQWAEPFGIAVIEAMASGTPVLALSRGAMPELIEPGVGGFLAESKAELIELVGHLHEIDPHRCAESARRRFSAKSMAAAYERTYQAALRHAAV